jgi:hypothetical protein
MERRAVAVPSLIGETTLSIAAPATTHTLHLRAPEQISCWRPSLPCAPRLPTIATTQKCAEAILDRCGAFRSTLAYFFTQTFFASSHFMFVIFSQSAFVFGGSAANAGALTAKRSPAMMAVLKILADIDSSPWTSRHPIDTRNG